MIPQALPKSMPRAPRLHWGWVLALVILTRGLFAFVWLIVQANWVRKVNGTSKAFWWSIVNVCMLPGLFLLGVIEALVRAEPTGMAVVMGFSVLAVIVTNLGTVFTLRSELESAPIGIPLGAVATFFFQTTYFQYHLHDYDAEGKDIPEGSLGLTS